MCLDVTLFHQCEQLKIFQRKGDDGTINRKRKRQKNGQCEQAMDAFEPKINAHQKNINFHWEKSVCKINECISLLYYIFSSVYSVIQLIY